MRKEEKITCPKCGAEMNHHAEKVDFTTALMEPHGADPVLGGVIEEVHTCPACQFIVTRISV